MTFDIRFTCVTCQKRYREALTREQEDRYVPHAWEGEGAFSGRSGTRVSIRTT